MIAKNHVCELLTFCMAHHGYRIKYFVIRNNVLVKVSELMSADEKYVALCECETELN
jgi:protein phosphatase-4 regulatory subunit 3